MGNAAPPGAYLHLGRRILVLALALGGVAALAAAPAFAQATFRIAVDSDAKTLDPALENGVWGNVLAYVAQPLLTLDRSGTIVPDLATDWHRSADGSTVVFHLRRGVSFQDGTPFDARAAKWNLQRVMDPKVHSLIRVAFSDVSSIEIVDPYTLVLHLTLPAMDPVPALATMFTAMLSPASVKEHGNTYRTIHWPVGTGPYRFASYRKETRVVMDRFEGYWGRKSYYPHVEFQIVPSSATRRAMLLAGQTDMAVAPSLSDLAALKADPRVDVSLTPSDLSFYVGLNTSRPPLDDVRVRQALNYAVNKAAIIHDVLHDTVTRADSVVPASVFGYARLRPYVYDPAKAKALLADAGVKPGSLTLHMIVPTNHATDGMTIAQAIAGQLRDVGIHLVIEPLDWAAYLASIDQPESKNTNELFLDAIASPDLTAFPILLGFTCGWTPPRGQNAEFYCNHQVDQLVTSGATQPDPRKQDEAYGRAMRIIWHDAPRIWLWTAEQAIAYASDVTDIWGLPNGEFDAIYARPVQ